MIAVISDVHANLEALEAVLAHIDTRTDAERVLCLGDVVGYGPDPAAVIDLVQRRCERPTMGNHDYAMLHSPAGFNRIAAEAIACQRRKLEGNAQGGGPGSLATPKQRQGREFLRSMRKTAAEGEDLLVHASPRSPMFEYIFAQDVQERPNKLRELFDMVARRCYVGHTHEPGVFTEEPRFCAPAELGMEFGFAGHGKLIINVGSVGQPRDQDWRACYATVTEDGVCWHRVEYDIDTTVEKVRADRCLNDRCGLRLLVGR